MQAKLAIKVPALATRRAPHAKNGVLPGNDFAYGWSELALIVQSSFLGTLMVSFRVVCSIAMAKNLVGIGDSK